MQGKTPNPFQMLRFLHSADVALADVPFCFYLAPVVNLVFGESRPRSFSFSFFLPCLAFPFLSFPFLGFCFVLFRFLFFRFLFFRFVSFVYCSMGRRLNRLTYTWRDREMGGAVLGWVWDELQGL